MDRVNFKRLADAENHDSASLACPPCNIEVIGENAYRLTQAVAGFAREHLDIAAQENELSSTGLARRDFERRFAFVDRASGSRQSRAGRFSARWIWAGAAIAPAEEYRRKAGEFRKQAASVKDGALRQAYLDIADEYERLAMEVEKAQRGNGDS